MKITHLGPAMLLIILYGTLFTAECWSKKYITKTSREKICSQDYPEEYQSIYMKATEFIMETIANPRVEEMLTTIKDEKQHGVTNFYEEAQKFQEKIAEMGGPDILRKKSFSDIYRGAAFSVVMQRKGKNLDMHTDITVTRDATYVLADDKHTKVSVVYRHFSGGCEHLIVGRTLMLMSETIQKVHEINEHTKNNKYG